MEKAGKGKFSEATKDAPFDQASAKKPGTNEGRCTMGEPHHVLEDVLDSFDTMCLSPRSDDPTSPTSESLSQASPLRVRYEDTTTIKIEGLNTVHADNVNAGPQVKIHLPPQKSVITLRFSRFDNGLPVYDIVSPVSDTRATTQGVKEESTNVKKMPSQIITASSSFQTDITIGKAMSQAPTLVRGTGAIPKEHGQIKPDKDLVIPESRKEIIQPNKKEFEKSNISFEKTSAKLYKSEEYKHTAVDLIETHDTVHLPQVCKIEENMRSVEFTAAESVISQTSVKGKEAYSIGQMQAHTVVRGTGAIPKVPMLLKPDQHNKDRRKKVEKSKKKMSGNELTSEQSEISDVDTSFGFFENPEEVNFLKLLHDQLIEAKLAFEENELIRSINLSYSLEHIQDRIQYLRDRVLLESSTSLPIGVKFDTQEKDAFDIRSIRDNTDTTDPESSNEVFRTAESRPSSSGSIMTEKSTSTFSRNTFSTHTKTKMTKEEQSSLTKKKEKKMRQASSIRSARNKSCSEDESASTIISNVHSMSLQTKEKQRSLTKKKEKKMRQASSIRSARNKSCSEDESASTIISNIHSMSLQTKEKQRSLSKKKEKKIRQASSIRSARNKSCSEDESASTIISNVHSMSLQESLRLRRPKFIDHAERRSALIQELAEKRKLRAEIRKNYIRDHGFEAAVISMTSIVPPPPLAEQRLFTRQEMLLCNQKLWQNMSEQQFRLLEEQREKDKEMFRKLRILYGKKLKDRAIKKKINVSNASSILAEDDQEK